jgi:hypothetical protein
MAIFREVPYNEYIIQTLHNIFMYVFFVMHIPEDGHMDGRNM